MDNLADDYMKELSKKLQDFPESFNKLWLSEKASNNVFSNANANDKGYVFILQEFAKAQLSQFAETLPAKGKEHIDNLQKKVDEFSGKTNKCC